MKQDMKKEKDMHQKELNKGRKELTEEQQKMREEKIKREKELDAQRKEKKDFKGEGNAHGRNKGEMKGKDFGQQRVAEAKRRQEQARAAYQKSKTNAKERLNSAEVKIKKAREEAEAARAAKKLNEKDYAAKIEKIERAEKALAKLKESLTTQDK